MDRSIRWSFARWPRVDGGLLFGSKHVVGQPKSIPEIPSSISLKIAPSAKLDFLPPFPGGIDNPISDEIGIRSGREGSGRQSEYTIREKENRVRAKWESLSDSTFQGWTMRYRVKAIRIATMARILLETTGRMLGEVAMVQVWRCTGLVKQLTIYIETGVSIRALVEDCV